MSLKQSLRLARRRDRAHLRPLDAPRGACGAIYLFLTMLLSGHFSIGYVWILPDGGYEFGIFWSVIVGVFMVVCGGIQASGRGPASVYHEALRWSVV
jgi:hypothetical protein